MTVIFIALDAVMSGRSCHCQWLQWAGEKQATCVGRPRVPRSGISSVSEAQT